MFLIQSNGMLWLLLLLQVLITVSGFERAPSNRSYANTQDNPSNLASIFSPRMDFEQWKPLTGRGDPLRNDPTYDYEPPVLERVHYWADDTKPERQTHYSEKKSEVLMLGVSSRKPSVTPRQPLPPRRHQFRLPPPKYEDYTYKLSDTYPMTILVPPPFPPAGHQPSLFILPQEKPVRNVQNIVTEIPQLITKEITELPERQTSVYTLQPSNLIYQSSTINQNWIQNVNQTAPQKVVSSDYAGWGPTTPIDDYDLANETHNIIPNNDHYIQVSKHPYSFYKPMLSESPPPPPPPEKQNLYSKTTFLPTVLPPTFEPTTARYEVETTTSSSTVMWPTDITTYEVPIEDQDNSENSETETPTILYRPFSNFIESTTPRKEISIFDMLGPMMSMPINGPERPEDNLYANASENMQIYKETTPEDPLNLETMQTMQPPPPIEIKNTVSSGKLPYHSNPKNVNTLHMKPRPTHDPYLHMRYTTPIPVTSQDGSLDKMKSTTESSTPMYLIIQGHSKVKTYGSKPKDETQDKHTTNNEIPKPNETNEVKHLHPKERLVKKQDPSDGYRKSKARDLQSLIDVGHGSIEIQEADIGIKYDVSDGSDVPVEVYRKGIVENDLNHYKTSEQTANVRQKRQLDLEDLIPFDEDVIEEYVYNFFEGNKNKTGLTGLIAQAVTSDEASAVDELEDDDETESDPDHEDR